MGFRIKPASAVRGDGMIVLEADAAQVKPGLKGTLILSASAQAPGCTVAGASNLAPVRFAGRLAPRIFLLAPHPLPRAGVALTKPLPPEKHRIDRRLRDRRRKTGFRIRKRGPVAALDERHRP